MKLPNTRESEQRGLETLQTRYEAALAAIPAPGNGCNPALLGVANLGVLIGLTDAVIRSDIQRHIPHGDRTVTDAEIDRAIAKARKEVTPAAEQTTRRDPLPARRPARPAVRTSKDTLKHLLQKGSGVGEADIWEASKIRIDCPPEDDPVLLLETVYRPDDLLFIGDRYDEGTLGGTIRPAADWIDYFRSGFPALPHIIPNPLTGEVGHTKDGKPSYRSDDCIADYRFAVVEFDDLGRDEQLAFWAAVPLPVVALIDTGGKSIHGWIRVDCTDAADWEETVEKALYAERLVPLGVDPQCKTDARLSRLPGHRRGERWQRLLYLDPEGGRLDVL